MENVVLLNEDGTAAGQALKSQVHTTATPLHLAFSCYVLNQDGAVLVTRRALSKITWPGVWTNSFCGHPQPGETFSAAIHRRARQELGLEITEPQIVLPDFRYRAIDASGIVENEICPVFTAEAIGDIVPNSDEISEYIWVQPAALTAAVSNAPFVFSPWLVSQLPQLRHHPDGLKGGPR